MICILAHLGPPTELARSPYGLDLDLAPGDYSLHAATGWGAEADTTVHVAENAAGVRRLSIPLRVDHLAAEPGCTTPGAHSEKN